MAVLKVLAHTCNFTTALNDMLRDRFVMGLSNDKTQHALLAEADLTFTRAVEIATAREAARRDVQAMGKVSVHKVQHSSQKFGKSSNSKCSYSENSHSQFQNFLNISHLQPGI